MADLPPPPAGSVPPPPVVPEVETPAPSGNVVTRDPVRWAQVLTSFVGAIVTVLLAVGLNQAVGAVLVGIMTAASAAIQELVVRPETVPRAPLEDLAAGKR